jgi:long-subunit fatty acid transport protein
MPSSKQFVVVSLFFIPNILVFNVYATGLNFWESSTTNSALASANGAKAVDASILATAPSSMTQLTNATLTASVTRYQVDTDYSIFGQESQYSKSDPIPAGFLVSPINENWSFGLAMYSRTAADISVPEMNFGLFRIDEVRVRPVVVSFAPSVAYQWGNISIAMTAEYLYADYLFERNDCNIFGKCHWEETKGDTDGWSGAVSVTWLVNDMLSIAANHRSESEFGDENIGFDLPSITSVYASVELIEGINWHSSYSLSRWKGKSIQYADYSDFIGLLKGSRHSNRYATSVEYRTGNLSFMAGVSLDQAIDAFGGDDVRYRLGAGYDFGQNLRVDVGGFVEKYATKELNEKLGSYIASVNVQNSGYGVSLGLTYQF